MTELLTDKEYVDNAGNKCPKCHAKDCIETGSQFLADVDYAWQDCSCTECGAIWTNHYKLTGYNNLENS